MAVIIWLFVWFVAGLGFSFAFESGYPIWRLSRIGALSKVQIARAYWAAVCLFGFVGATPLAPLAILPVAISHTDLAKTNSDGITMSTVARHIPDALRGLLRRISH